MSILKQVLSEALSSAFKKSSASKADRPADARELTVGGEVRSADSSRSFGSGMMAVILNWKAGENDPFRHFDIRRKRHDVSRCEYADKRSQKSKPEFRQRWRCSA